MRKGSRKSVGYVYAPRLYVSPDRWEHYGDHGHYTRDPNDAWTPEDARLPLSGWRTVGRKYAKGRKRATAWRVPSARALHQAHTRWWGQGLVDRIAAWFRGADMS